MYFFLQLSLWNFVLFFIFKDYPGRILISWLCFIGWFLLHSFRKKYCWKYKYQKYGWKWLIPGIILHVYPLKVGSITTKDLLYSLIIIIIWNIILLVFKTNPFKLYQIK